MPADPRKRLSPKAMQTPRRGEPKPPAPDVEPTGDHAITPEIVAGSSRISRIAQVVRGRGPSAASIITNLRTLIDSEIARLAEARRIGEGDRKYFLGLIDASTKLLREERRQNELEDWTRLSEEELWEALGEKPGQAPQLPPTASDEEPSE